MFNRDLKNLLLLLTIIVFTGCDSNSDLPSPVYPSHYTEMQIEGFHVFVENETLKRVLTEKAITLLDEKLEEITEFELKEDILQDLQQVKIFMDWIQTDRCGVYYGDESDEKNQSIGFENIEDFISCIENGKPYLVLHELSHAYHDRILDHSFQPITDAYDHAMELNLYDSVEYLDGSYKEAYATTNFKEYFAELTESFWGINDCYPFTREQLMDHDTLGYRVLYDIWAQ